MRQPRQQSENKAAARRKAWAHAQRHPHAGIVRRIRRHLLKVPGIGLLAVWLLLVVIRVFVQDRFQGPLAYAYYASPPVVLAGLAILASLWWAITRHWRTALVTLVVGFACLGWTYGTMWYHNTLPQPGPDCVKLMYWNVAWGGGGWESLAGEIRAQSPDIVALVEGREPVRPQDTTPEQSKTVLAAATHRAEQRWKELLPEYEIATHTSGLIVLSRHGITRFEYDYLGGNYFTAFGNRGHAVIPLERGTLHVILADVANRRSTSREIPLNELVKQLAALDDEAAVLVGDFNTPLDSIHFEPLRRRFSNAFQFAGNGYAATWPAVFPVLTIDQAWFNSGVRVDRCEILPTTLSDHRPIVLDLALSGANQESMNENEP